MKILSKLAVFLLVVGLIFGIMGCDEDKGNENGGENTGGLAKYYEGSYRDNRNGTTEVVNNTSFDMLLFEGEIISTNYIIGGVKSGTRNNINFSGESDWQVGGYKLLRAVKQKEFEANGDKSRIDHSALITYGEGKRFTTNITSTTDGDYQYTVYNRSRDYGLELRLNSPEGQKVAYLTKGEVRRVINSPSINELTLYPVWVAYNSQTKSIVTFAPTDILAAQDVQPKRPNEDVSPIYFPLGGQTVITFPSINLPFATVQVRNNASMTANFRVANTIRTPESGYTGISSGARESYEIRSSGEGLHLNLAMAQGQIEVPVRFQDKPNDPNVVIENGYLYTVTLSLKPGAEADKAASYEAWLVAQETIDTSKLLVSH